MIQPIADLFHQRLESDEVEDDPRLVQLSLYGDGDLVIVAVKRLSSAIGKNKEVR